MRFTFRNTERAAVGRKREKKRKRKTNEEPCLFVFVYVVYTGLRQYRIIPFARKITPA